jgi:hypothetical protein
MLETAVSLETAVMLGTDGDGEAVGAMPLR